MNFVLDSVGIACGQLAPSSARFPQSAPGPSEVSGADVMTTSPGPAYCWSVSVTLAAPQRITRTPNTTAMPIPIFAPRDTRGIL
jgi:hypothetical protein